MYVICFSSGIEDEICRVLKRGEDTEDVVFFMREEFFTAYSKGSEICAYDYTSFYVGMMVGVEVDQVVFMGRFSIYFK